MNKNMMKLLLWKLTKESLDMHQKKLINHDDDVFNWKETLNLCITNVRLILLKIQKLN